MALGFFDGVHRGHQGILRGARDLAARLGLEAVAFTFLNHPHTVLAPDRAPELLSDRTERFRLIQRQGLVPVWLEFVPEFSRISPHHFVRRILRERLEARAVSVGPNYRFGYRAKGDPSLLVELAGPLGFEVSLAAAVESGGQLVSSSRIRDLVRQGRVDEAAAMLGRPYRVEGLVEAGHSRGTGLGRPTANLRIPRGKVAPATGVYAVWAGVDGVLRPGVANFGTRPTFGGGDPLLEVHLLDFEGDLYGRPLEVFLASYLRPERPFPDAAALAAQILEDVARARQVLSQAPPPQSLLPSA